jgi:hypothetical protein
MSSEATRKMEVEPAGVKPAMAFGRSDGALQRTGHDDELVGLTSNKSSANAQRHFARWCMTHYIHHRSHIDQGSDDTVGRFFKAIKPRCGARANHGCSLCGVQRVATGTS